MNPLHMLMVTSDLEQRSLSDYPSPQAPSLLPKTIPWGTWKEVSRLTQVHKHMEDISGDRTNGKGLKSCKSAPHFLGECGVPWVLHRPTLPGASLPNGPSAWVSDICRSLQKCFIPKKRERMDWPQEAKRELQNQN